MLLNKIKDKEITTGNKILNDSKYIEEILKIKKYNCIKRFFAMREFRNKIMNLDLTSFTLLDIAHTMQSLAKYFLYPNSDKSPISSYYYAYKNTDSIVLYTDNIYIDIDIYYVNPMHKGDLILALTITNDNIKIFHRKWTDDTRSNRVLTRFEEDLFSKYENVLKKNFLQALETYVTGE